MEPMDTTPTAPRLSAVLPIMVQDMFAAVESGDVKYLAEVYTHGVVNDHGNTLLHRAVQLGKQSCLEWLLRYTKEDVMATNINGDTLLHLAAYYERSALVPLLLAAGALIDVPNKNGQTPLAIALVRLDRDTSEGREEMVKLLLDKGADKEKVKGIVVPAWCRASVLVTPTARKAMEREVIKASIRPDQWACETCTFANELAARECAMCGTAAPVQVEPPVRVSLVKRSPSPVRGGGSQRSPSPSRGSSIRAQPAVWACKSCTYQNDALLTECEMCGGPK